MYHRRSQGDAKSTSSMTSSISSMPAATTNPPSTSTPGRVSIYSMRERVIQNKLTRIMGKLAPDTETEVTSRLHQEIPAIRLDGHLTYSLYSTLQNLMHLNAMFILLYHTVFWLDTNSFDMEIVESAEAVETTTYEQTHLVTVLNSYYTDMGKSVNVKAIPQHVYLSLVAVSSIELLVAFLWTIKKKLPHLLPRYQRWKSRLSLLLVGMIVLVYMCFIGWICFHTFVTHYLSETFSLLILGHLLVLTILDKPNLFQRSPGHFSRPSALNRKQYRNSTSSSSTSSTAASGVGRHSYRSSASTQSRPVKLVGQMTSFDSAPLASWSRWSSLTEGKVDAHDCSTFYTQARREADDLWPIVARRLALNLYRTFASFILYDLVPIQMMGPHLRSATSQPLKLFITIITLSTFITHSAFLFPVKLLTTLHRLATHLGQWRPQSLLRTDTINEWSPECNSYTRGSVVKLPSNHQQHFLAVQHLGNAAHPQSKSHATLYRLFGDATYILTVQFLLCIALIMCQIIWLIRGKYWEQILVGSFNVFHSSYPIYKIVRDRLVVDFVEDNEHFHGPTTSKQKKSS